MNSELAKIFKEMAVFWEMENQGFKARAYERAAYTLGGLAQKIEEIYQQGGRSALENIPGVGKSLGDKIEEYLKWGEIKEYNRFKKKFPLAIAELEQIEGLGSKNILKLYRQLAIKNMADLEIAARRGQLRKLTGWGVKSEQKILKSISFLKQSKGRFLLSTVLPLAREIIERLRARPEVKRAEYAGSLARWQETAGDLDLLVISPKPSLVMDFFIKMPEVQTVLIRGETKVSVRLKMGMDADLRVIAPGSFGAAWQYFIGDKFHNVAIRTIAKEKGYKLNEYGLFKGRKLMVAKDEKEIYEKLNLDWIPPELRTNQGELEAAYQHQLPNLIGYRDLRGDLQVQTDWTDGEHSIREMAEAAQKEGLEYIAITDHTKTLGVAGGLDERKILAQMGEIDKVQKEVPNLKILKGAEVNILKDGSLDINDETLAKLEVVGASVHSHFNLSEKEMTDRIIKAMNNPHVDLIFHPTGRLIQKREPYQVDLLRLIAAAKKTQTVLEANACPERLDLKDEYIRQAIKEGVKISIDSDAHAVGHFKYLEYGLGQARRGWAEKKDVINAWPWEEMLKMLKPTRGTLVQGCPL